MGAEEVSTGLGGLVQEQCAFTSPQVSLWEAWDHVACCLPSWAQARAVQAQVPHLYPGSILVLAHRVWTCPAGPCSPTAVQNPLVHDGQHCKGCQPCTPAQPLPALGPMAHSSSPGAGAMPGRQWRLGQQEEGLSSGLLRTRSWCHLRGGCLLGRHGRDLLVCSPDAGRRREEPAQHQGGRAKQPTTAPAALEGPGPRQSQLHG